MSHTSKLRLGMKLICTYSMMMPMAILRKVIKPVRTSQAGRSLFRCQECSAQSNTNPPKSTICAILSRFLMPKSPMPGIALPGRHKSTRVSMVQKMGKNLVLLNLRMSFAINSGKIVKRCWREYYNIRKLFPSRTWDLRELGSRLSFRV